jgi:four helix bundle protein
LKITEFEDLKMRNDRPNKIVELTFQFSLEITSFSESLNERGKKVVSNQLIKSGTSIGANVREAQNAESKVDFIHKMKIAAKETDETKYWLELVNSLENYPSDEFLLQQVSEIEKVLSKIISSSKKFSN